MGEPGGDDQKCPETILVEGNNADRDGSNRSCAPHASTTDGSNCSFAPPPSSNPGPPSSRSGSGSGLTESDSEPSYEPPSGMTKKAPPKRNVDKAQNSQKAKTVQPKKATKSERSAAKNAQAKKAPKRKPDKKK